MVTITLLAALCSVVAFLMAYFAAKKFDGDSILAYVTYWVLGGVALAWIVVIIIAGIKYSFQ